MSPWPKFLVYVAFGNTMCTLGCFIATWTVNHIYEQPLFFKLPLMIGSLCATSMILCRLDGSFLTRVLYYCVCFCWGSAIYSSFFAVVLLIFRLFCEPSPTVSLVLIFVPALFCLLYGYYNAYRLRINKLHLSIPGINKSVRMVHISDLHLGPVYGRKYVEKVVAEIKLLNPELVMITGDLFDGSMKVDPFMLKPFSELEAKIYFALGNHDYFLGIEEVKKSLKYSNIILLENQQADCNGISVIGIGYEFAARGLIKQLERQEISQSRLNVLLYHTPQISVDTVEQYNINLWLSGHVHGGQIAPLFCKQFGEFKYLKGLHRSSSGKSYVNISVGTATGAPPLRMFSRSTIDLLNINCNCTHPFEQHLSLIHICRCRRIERCRSRWSPYH
eukprot:TRINITY_DN3630_c0_g1_i9.p1 TRINITY_DN3630_c0_g1~~TRINITY_DN3630_c0_g1_i9.p1  ORF type:complete len:389 (+),score=29.69 TRINITY_DN3630_c0_g1_i9:60-1226(+)